MADTIKTLPRGSETILIVDDHETIWDFLIEALQKLGYCVLLAENGLDAVEIYQDNPDQIDLVLLDMIMPKAGGHQTFFKIRELSLTYDVPSSFASKLRMKSASVGLVAQNLLLWSKDFKYSDPDGGTEDLSDPSSRYLGFNIKVSF